MSFIKQTFDIKKLVRNLDEAPAIPNKLAAKEQAEATSADLSEYVYQRLFLPIVQDGSVPLEGLDFSLISEDELDMLVNGSLKMHKKVWEKMYRRGIRDFPFQTVYC